MLLAVSLIVPVNRRVFASHETDTVWRRANDGVLLLCYLRQSLEVLIATCTALQARADVRSASSFSRPVDWHESSARRV